MSKGCLKLNGNWLSYQSSITNHQLPITNHLACLAILTCIHFFCGLGLNKAVGKQVYGDIVVSPATLPSGESYHGYVEYVVSVTNTSTEKQHRVTLVFPNKSYGYGDHIHRITRSVVLGPSSSALVSILQPPLSMEGSDLRVIIDGKSQRQRVPLNVIAHCRDRGYGSRGFCILLSQKVSRDDFANGVGKLSGRSSSSYRRFGRSSQEFKLLKAESPVEWWSKNWLAYSRYDGIVITAYDMEKIPAEVKSALWQYVECGGSLLILGRYNIPEHQPSVQDNIGTFETYYVGFGICLVSDTTDVTTWHPSVWPELKSQVWDKTAMPWWNSMDIYDANRRFPVVANLGIPVRGLFLLVLLFAVLIGPVNLIILSRKKKRIWMLMTVPVTSLITCLAVFTYALFAEGWSAYVRTQTITLLNEATQRATTIGWTALYSPLTPRDGLHFDAESEVSPLGIQRWYRPSRGRARTIKWTEDQHLDTGWVAARVPAHFMVRKSQIRRERLKFSREKDGKLVALNGLGVDIRELWFADTDGKIYSASRVPAGKQVALRNEQGITASAKPNLLRELFSSDWISGSDRMTNRLSYYLRSGCYIAVLDRSPFIEKGLNNVKSREYKSVVYGICEESV